jgi:hypothetical protein
MFIGQQFANELLECNADAARYQSGVDVLLVKPRDFHVSITPSSVGMGFSLHRRPWRREW